VAASLPGPADGHLAIVIEGSEVLTPKHKLPEGIKEEDSKSIDSPKTGVSTT